MMAGRSITLVAIVFEGSILLLASAVAWLLDVSLFEQVADGLIHSRRVGPLEG